MLVGLLMLGGAAAGAFGSLLGLGGGVLIVPLLTFGLGLPLREAVGVSLVCVIMTSNAAAGIYLERHLANLRLGMALELFTATGALIGGLVAFLLDERLLSLMFGALLLYVAAMMIRARSVEPTLESEDFDDESNGSDAQPGPPIAIDRLAGPGYRVRRLGLGVGGATGAGIVSALLGIGGGIIMVPLMHLSMGVPLRVATATSNMMIGITATVSAVIYLVRGGIDPYVAGPTAIGVFVGATAGSRLAHRIDLRYLRVLFVVVLVWAGIQMVLRGIGGTR